MVAQWRPYTQILTLDANGRVDKVTIQFDRTRNWDDGGMGCVGPDGVLHYMDPHQPPVEHVPAFCGEVLSILYKATHDRYVSSCITCTKHMHAINVCRLVQGAPSRQP